MVARFLPWLLLAAASATVHGTELDVLMAVVMDGKALEKNSPAGHAAPVFSRVTDGELFERLQHEAHTGFTATMLSLDDAAQRIAGYDSAHPTWLLLSEEEGGYARSGFWLKDGENTRYVPDPFVDLVVDTASIDDGSFEEIFAHELGHVFLRRLLPHLPQGFSRVAHGSLAITDPPTAFDEGFAIHFQALARRLTRNERLHAQDIGVEAKPFVAYWASNVDRTLRIEGVRRNVFVQAQVPLPEEGDSVLAREASNLFDFARLKNGDQMMASEGVVASVFYRWLATGDGSDKALVERYSLLFSALAALDHTELTPDSPILVRLVQTYTKLHALESADAVRALVETTYGATIESALPRQTERLAEAGRRNDGDAFVGQLKEARGALAKVVEDASRSPARLDAALSPAIWLAADTKVLVNANTAERENLIVLPGIDPTLADRIVAERRKNGPFQNISDLVSRAGLQQKTAAAIKTLNEGALRAGTNARR